MLKLGKERLFVQSLFLENLVALPKELVFFHHNVVVSLQQLHHLVTLDLLTKLGLPVLLLA